MVGWRAGLARTVRGSRSLQLGVGADAFVLEGLTATDWQLLGLLERAPARTALLAAVERVGLPRARCEQLLGLLAAAGALVEPADGTAPDGTGRATGRAAGRAAVRDDVTAGGGPGRAASLAGAEVAVVGGGGLGVLLAVTLAAAGAATSALVDDATVSATDVLPGGAGHGDVGRRAAHVAAEAVHRVRPDVRTACPEDPDLVVLVSAQVADAPAGTPLVQRGTLHLPVVVRADDVVVGPLVVPGRGACLHCLDLHHRDLDPGWPDAVRLLRRGHPRAPVPAVATATVVSGLVTTVLTAPDLLLRAGVEVRLEPSGATTWRRWAPHPVCGCVGWPDPGPAPAGTGGPDGSGASDPPAPAPRPGATMAA